MPVPRNDNKKTRLHPADESNSLAKSLFANAIGAAGWGLASLMRPAEGRSRCIVRVFAAMLQPKRFAVAIVAAFCAGGVIKTSIA